MKFFLLLFPAMVLAGEAIFAKKTPKIDGVGDDLAWAKASWVNIDQLVLGKAPTEVDFQGRHKVIWNGDGLFTSGDFATAFAAGSYEVGPRMAALNAETSNRISC